MPRDTDVDKKIGVPGCSEKSHGQCVNIACCDKPLPIQKDSDGTHLCYATPRPPLSKGLSRLIRGDGPHS